MAECPDASALPERLCDRDQWVCWRTRHRDGKPTKVPIDPVDGGFASATDPDTWAPFDDARSYARATDGAGLGFVFTESDPLVGVDLDDCRDPETGELDTDARDIVERLDSYTEVSPSGTGVHVLLTGDLPAGRNRRGAVECYDQARFFTVTGDGLEAFPEQIRTRQDALLAIHQEYVAEEPSSNGPQSDTCREEDSMANPQAPAETSSPGSATAADGLSDDELLERARSAANGRKFTRLWNGQTSGYDSHSEADMALCCLLAFWTGGDEARIDRLFRRSGLLRDKWNEVHYADRATYGERTVERAVEATSEFYDPANARDQSSTDRASDDSDPTPTADTQDTGHLAEQNDLLLDRVQRLEAELDARSQRITELEAALDADDHTRSAESNASQATDDHTLEDSDATDEHSMSTLDRLRHWAGGLR